MNEALWWVTYGVMWWWVALMLGDGAWPGTFRSPHARDLVLLHG